jgi:DDE superfamily endonuclease
LPDPSIQADKWAVMADKGYIGANDVARIVVPHKNPRNGRLTVEQRGFNASLSRARIICENFYGRLKKTFAITHLKYRGDLKNYDSAFDTCVALTNLLIRDAPLRQEDRDFYQRVRAAFYALDSSATAIGMDGFESPDDAAANEPAEEEDLPNPFASSNAASELGNSALPSSGRMQQLLAGSEDIFNQALRSYESSQP